MKPNQLLHSDRYPALSARIRRDDPTLDWLAGALFEWRPGDLFANIHRAFQRMDQREIVED